MKFWHHTLAMALGVFVANPSAEEPRVTQSPISFGAFQEFGSVYNGLYSAGDRSGEIKGMEWVDHFGAYFSKSAIVNDRLHISVGLGGVFQFRKPEKGGTLGNAGGSFDSHQRKAFFIGPQTEVVYHFGQDPAEPWLKLGAGMFPYKYNQDAWNLGEHLFRSRAYPTVTSTGGYVIVNSAAPALQGFKASTRWGGLKADALLTTETELAPFYDWSLAFVGSYTALEGLLELGAGVNFHHLIPVTPSRTTSRIRENSYFADPATGEYYVGNLDYYANPRDFYFDKGTPQDSAKALLYAAQGTIAETLYNLPEGQGRPEMRYFSSRSTMLMARAALDLKKMFPSDAFGPQDLRLYGEVNLLGVKDYPVYYTDMRKRMPIMAGFNFPGFGLLDLLAVQAEYFSSPWLNNTFPLADKRNNIPYFPQSSDKVLSRVEYNDQAGRDDWKWSLLARKTIKGRLTLAAQFARDHLRMPSSQYYYGPQHEPNEITASDDSWYWMTHISWGL